MILLQQKQMGKLSYLVLVCFFAQVLLSCKNSEEAPSAKIVKVTNVSFAGKTDDSKFPFIAKPFKNSQLSFRVGGPLVDFNSIVGDYYSQGKVIAQIDNRDFIIRKEKAKSLYSQAEAEYNRLQKLFDLNNISASAYEKAKADYFVAKNNYQTASNELDDTKLIAPFNGYVSEVYTENYQDVKPQQPILSLVDVNTLKLEIYVPQKIAMDLKKGDTVQVDFDMIKGGAYSAIVDQVAKSASENNLSFLVTALFNNMTSNFPSGISGVIYLKGKSEVENSMILPVGAICYDKHFGDYVWVENAAKASRVKIVKGDLLKSGDVIIKAGLDGSERVIISGTNFLESGMEVIVCE